MMIRNCIIHRLSEQKIIDSPKLDPYKSEHFDRVLPIYQKMNLEQWNVNGSVKLHQGNMDMFQDRTGTLPHYLKVAAPEPLPEYDSSFDKSFRQICLEAAQALVDTGKQINISWSGGLDSTTALFALMEVADPKQLKVFGNFASIVESGNMLEKHIIPRGVGCHISLPLMTPLFDEGLIVSGFPGDQLFGRYSTLQLNDYTMAWQDWIPRNQVDLMSSMIEKFPGPPIKTVPEFLSFLELNGKWQMAKSQRQRALPTAVANRFVAFYDTVDFQRWAIGRYEEKYLSSDPRTHKWAEKKFLKDCGLDFYAENKVVQTSHYHIVDHQWVMDLTDGTKLYMKDFI
jgi:hypothetical protein